MLTITIKDPLLNKDIDVTYYFFLGFLIAYQIIFFSYYRYLFILLKF
jgi:hypothetical protein